MVKEGRLEEKRGDGGNLCQHSEEGLLTSGNLSPEGS